MAIPCGFEWDQDGSVVCGLELTVEQLEVLIDMCGSHVGDVGVSGDRRALVANGVYRDLLGVRELLERLQGRSADND